MAGVRQRKGETRDAFLARRSQWWADKRAREHAEREARQAEYRERYEAERAERERARSEGREYVPPPLPTARREVWESWSEFVAHVEETPAGGWAQSHSAESDRWAGGSWAECAQMTRTGYTAALPEVERWASQVADKVIDLRLAESMEWTRDVTGQVVDVAAFLMGEPECMIEAVQRPVTAVGPLVRLVVPITASAGVSEEIIRKRGAAVIALVSVLVRAGHTLEIWAQSAVTSEGKRVSTAVKVQDSRDPIDMPRIMFALGHPGMLRRTVFATMEHYEREIRQTFHISAHGGYGIPDGATAEDVPDHAGKTVILPKLDSSKRWEEAEAVEWATQTLDSLAD